MRHVGGIKHATVEHDAENRPFVKKVRVRTVIVDAQKDLVAMAILRALARPYVAWQRAPETKEGNDAFDEYLRAIDLLWCVPLD